MLDFKRLVRKGLPLVLLSMTGCDFNLSRDEGEGTLTFHFPQNVDLPTVPLVSLLPEEERKTASVAESSVEVQLDTNDFIISVTNSSGASLYYGTFGAAPEKIITSAGTYTITAKSCDFYTPVFSSPQFGDTKVALVSAGKECSVTLDCVQLNSGVRLQIDPEFLTEYPNGVLFLKSSEGKLMYGYSEKRIAYFRPGKVSLVLSDSGTETTLATYTLEARQILDLKLEISASSSARVESGIHIQVDTSRVWVGDKLVIGESGGGSSDKGSEKSDALSIGQAQEMAGATEVWVYGYIVGGDLSSSKCSFTPPFSSRTNIVLAAKSSCTDKENCLSVQLSTGKIRNALNLVDNPGLLGKKIYLKGDIVEAYYGIPGLQSVTEYEF